MPNYNLTLQSTQKALQGKQEERTESYRESSLSVRRARNSAEIPSTSPINYSRPFEDIDDGGSGGSSTSPLQLKGPCGFLFAMLMLSSIAPTEGMQNGAPLHSDEAKNFSPLLSGVNSATCSAVKLNSRQVITAKHCIASTGCRIVKNGEVFLPATINNAAPNGADVAICTYNRDLPGPSKCPPPVMSAATLTKLAANTQSNRCGIPGDLIAHGRGRESKSQNTQNRLKAGTFKYKKPSPPVSVKGKVYMQGIADGTHGVPDTLSGDSGGGLFGCNPDTQQYELIGVNSGADSTKTIKFCREVAFSADVDLKTWFDDNVQPCQGSRVNGYDLYPSRSHLTKNKPDARSCSSIHRNVIVGPRGYVTRVRINNNCPGEIKGELVEKLNGRVVKTHLYSIPEEGTAAIDIGQTKYTVTRKYKT